jgi:hypothetical protein
VISTLFLCFLTSSRTAKHVALNSETDNDDIMPPNDYGKNTMVILAGDQADVNPGRKKGSREAKTNSDVFHVHPVP